MIFVPESFCAKTVKDNGSNYEDLVAIEELSELIKAITKNKRYGTKKTQKDIVEEIADCYICLKTIEFTRKIDENDIQEAINYKIGRYLLSKENED